MSGAPAGSDTALIVDDDAHFARSLGRLLKQQGLRPQIASGVHEALQCLQRGLPRVLFVDLHMPVKSGHVLVRALRKLRSDLPIVVCSAAASREDLVQLLRAGASDFLDKPISRAELEDCLERIARQEQAHKVPAPPLGLTVGSTKDLSPTPTHASEQMPVGEAIGFRQKLIEAVDGTDADVPSLSPLLGGLQSLFENLHCSVQEILEVIESDPAIVTSLLRIARTPIYSGTRPPATLREACLLLGNRTVLAIAHEACLRATFNDGPPDPELLQSWQEAASTAYVARSLAMEGGAVDPEVAFLAGLLHNLGELVILRTARKLGERALQEHSDDVLWVSDARHETVGARTLRAWKMNSTLVRCARNHHGEPNRLDDATRQLRDVVMGAWWAVRCWLRADAPDAPEPWYYEVLPTPKEDSWHGLVADLAPLADDR